MVLEVGPSAVLVVDHVGILIIGAASSDKFLNLIHALQCLTFGLILGAFHREDEQDEHRILLGWHEYRVRLANPWWYVHRR